MRKYAEIVKQIAEDRKTMEILPTGLMGLDLVLDGGLIKRELIGLGGRTGGGKSLLAGTLFYNMAKNGCKSAYFSMEISNQMVVSRLIGGKSDVSPTRYMISQLRKEEIEATDKADAEIGTWEELMSFYDDIYELNALVAEIKKNDFEFIVVDFLQNIEAKQYRDDRERLAGVARTLQKLAKEKNCVIIAVSQLSNEQARNRKTSDVVEYMGSGAIGHAVDLGFFIETGSAGEGSLSLKLRKNRRGVSGTSFSFMIKQPGGRVIELD